MEILTGGLIIAILAAIIAIAVLSYIFMVITRYKVCPPNKLMVISGTKFKGDDSGQKKTILKDGGQIIWPVIRQVDFLDLKTWTIEVQLDDALSKENIRVKAPAKVTIAVNSTDQTTMENAATRLLGRGVSEINEAAKGIIFGQMRSVISGMTVSEINADRGKFEEKVNSALTTELKKLGFDLVNVNLEDVRDESGVIDAMGKKAAAEAKNAAEIDVAEEERKSTTRKAEIAREQNIAVAEETEKEEIEKARALQRQNSGTAEAKKEEAIAVKQAESEKITGVNAYRLEIEQSNAITEAGTAKAQEKATAEKAEAKYESEERALKAQEKAEVARALKLKAEKKANEIVQAEINAEKLTIAAKAAFLVKEFDAKADAAVIKEAGDAEAAVILAKEAAVAEGIRLRVEAAGGPDRAIQMELIKLSPELMGIYAEAIKGIQIDKNVIIGNGDSNGISGLAQDLLGVMPGLQEVLGTLGIEFGDFMANNKFNLPVSKPETEEVTVDSVEKEEDISPQDLSDNGLETEDDSSF